jgi:hypothetical protein
MNIDKLRDDIFADIARNRGLAIDSDEAVELISKMNFKEAWEYYCVWNGLFGSYHQKLASAYENMKKARR